MKTVILQPSYIPWRGYFHQIYKADLFIFYDDAQYDKHGWRNRNRIKTPQGTQWLTIPVLSAGIVSHRTPINQVRINWDKKWNTNHWSTIKQSYGKAPFFKQYEPLLNEFYQKQPELLADFTIELTVSIARELGIENTRFMRSSALTGISGNKTDRLINILKHVGATEYISGPSAQDYIESEKFKAADIKLEFMTYDYQPYKQLYPPYDGQVSILDLMFMTGPEALNHIV